MLENLLGQDAVVRLLRADIASKSLPRATLLEGPRRSGKLTAAIEIARALSCESGEASWTCPCPSCSRHRALVHPDLLLFGPKDFLPEISAGAAALAFSASRAGRLFLSRAARKLIRRFDQALYAGEESRLAKAAPLVQALEELLEEIEPKGGSPKVGSPKLGSPQAEVVDEPTSAALAKPVAKIQEASAKLAALVPDSVPIWQIRSMEQSARLAPNGKAKVIIIENADSMLEGARNALLKILEEPPDRAYIVLATSRKSALMQTILSRTRSYSFRERDAASQALVLERIFHLPREEAAAVGGVEAYLSRFRAFASDAADDCAAAFLFAVLSARTRPPAILPWSRGSTVGSAQGFPGSMDEAMAAVAKATGDFGKGDPSRADSFPRFLEALCSLLSGRLRQGDLDPARVALISSWNAMIREAASRNGLYSQSPLLLLEALAYGMREAP